jgi:hypothetical protein
VQKLTDLYTEYAPYVNEYLKPTDASKKKVNDPDYDLLIDELAAKTAPAVNSFEDSLKLFEMTDFDAADIETRRNYDAAASKASDAHDMIHDAESFLSENLDAFNTIDGEFTKGAESWYAAIGSAMHAIHSTFQDGYEGA